MSSKNSLSLSYFLTPFLLILFVLIKGSCLISIMFILILVSLNDNLLSQSFYCFYHYTYMYVCSYHILGNFIAFDFIEMALFFDTMPKFLCPCNKA